MLPRDWGQCSDSELGVEERFDREQSRALLFQQPAAPVNVAHFRLLHKLGQGAMGLVFAAEDEKLQRRVALKMLHGTLASEPARRARILREARALAALKSAHVVTLYEVFETAETICLVMELVEEGTNARGWLEQKPRSWREIVAIYIQAASGLQAAHDLGFVHRDFKPENLLVRPDGTAQVADFGVVRAFAPAANEATAGVTVARTSLFTLTEDGHVVGTPAYMPDEQCLGHASAQSDQYSFCIALFEALYGYNPRQSGVLTDRRASKRRVPARLRRIIDRGLHSLPPARWESMAMLARELGRVLTARQRLLGRASVAAVGVLVLSIAAAAHQVSTLEHTVTEALSTVRDRARRLALEQLWSDPTAAIALLAEVEHPRAMNDWTSLALHALSQPHARHVFGAADGTGAAAAIQRRGHCAALSRSNETVLWSSERPDRVRTLSFAASVLELSDDCRWLAARRAPDRWVLHDLTAVDPDRPPALEYTAKSSTFAPDSRGFVLSTGGSILAQALPPQTAPSALKQSAGGALSTLQFSHDGSRLLGKDSARLYVWLVEQTRLVELQRCELKRFGGVVKVGFSPDDRWIAAALSDGHVLVWSSAGDCGRPRIEGRHARAATAVRFSQDSQRVASASMDDTIKVWRLADGHERVLKGHGEVVSALAFAADGRSLFSASADKTLRAWDLVHDRLPLVFEGHEHDVSAIEALPGDEVLTTSRDGTLRLWTYAAAPRSGVAVHTAAIWKGVLDPARRRLATSSDDGTVQVVKLDDLSRVALRGHAGPVRELAFSADGRRLVSTSQDRTARVWDSWTGASVAVLDTRQTNLYGVAISPDGTRVATGDLRHSTALSWPAAGGTPVQLVHTSAHRGVESLAFDSAGRRLFTTSGNMLYAWDAQSGRELARYSGPDSGRLAEPHLDEARERLYAGSTTGIVPAWNLRTGEYVGALAGHTHRTLAVNGSRKGELLIVPSMDGVTSVWDAETMRLVKRLGRHRDLVSSADFDAATRRAVTSSEDGTARVWSLTDDRTPIELRGHVGGVRFAAFDWQDRVVTAGRSDGSVRTWEVPSMVDEAELMQPLVRATSYCLPGSRRMEVLRESYALAEQNYAACLARRGRAR